MSVVHVHSYRVVGFVASTRGTLVMACTGCARTVRCPVAHLLLRLEVAA